MAKVLAGKIPYWASYDVGYGYGVGYGRGHSYGDGYGHGEGWTRAIYYSIFTQTQD